LAPSSNSWPPNCQTSDWNQRLPVNWNGVAQLPSTPAVFILSSAAMYSSLVAGGFSGSRPAFSMTALL
jgi:hypothetical protein